MKKTIDEIHLVSQKVVGDTVFLTIRNSSEVVRVPIKFKVTLCTRTWRAIILTDLSEDMQFFVESWIETRRKDINNSL